MDSPTLNITPNAARRIAFLADKEGKAGLMLRVTVLGGGCSGFQYEIGFEDTVQSDDFVFGEGSGRVVTDATSMEFVNGAEIDYVQSMVKSEFKIKNPNAASGCGCGKSFSVRD